MAAVLFLGAPLAGLAARAPWSSLLSQLGTREVRGALGLSLFTSLSAALGCAVLGTPIAWALARYDFTGRRVVRALVLTPLVLPPVVGGVGLLLALGRRGLVGSFLYEGLGIQLPFTTAGAVFAETFVAIPFFILAAEGAFAGAHRRFEEAAALLGASRARRFFLVTVPLVAPGLIAGILLAWARALGEFGATITFAGNSPFKTTTIPLEVYLLLESGRFEQAIALSLVLVAVSLLVLFFLRDRWLRVE